MAKQNRKNDEGKYHFLFRNIFRGLLILAAFVLAFVLFRKFGGNDYKEWFNQLNTALVFTTFTLSEVFFGIITPEIFMAWGTEQGDWKTYFKILTGLTIISYAAGYLNYWIGRLFRQVSLIRWFLIKRMRKYSEYLNQYGGFLLIVACVTPLPFAAICLMVGSASYSHNKFLLYTLFRLVRFSVYGYVVWQAGGI